LSPAAVLAITFDQLAPPTMAMVSRKACRRCHVARDVLEDVARDIQVEEDSCSANGSSISSKDFTLEDVDDQLSFTSRRSAMRRNVSSTSTLEQVASHTSSIAMRSPVRRLGSSSSTLTEVSCQLSYVSMRSSKRRNMSSTSTLESVASHLSATSC